MKAKCRAVNLDEIVIGKTINDRLHVLEQQRLQRAVADVPRRDQKQLVRHAMNDQRIDEVAVLRDNDPFLAHRELGDGSVWGAVTLRKIQCVHGVVAAIPERINQSSWQLRVDEKLHAEKGCTRLVWLSRAA